MLIFSASEFGNSEERESGGVSKIALQMSIKPKNRIVFPKIGLLWKKNIMFLLHNYICAFHSNNFDKIPNQNTKIRANIIQNHYLCKF